MKKIKIIKGFNEDILRIASETAEIYGYNIEPIFEGKIFNVKDDDAEKLCLALQDCGVDARIIN